MVSNLDTICRSISRAIFLTPCCAQPRLSMLTNIEGVYWRDKICAYECLWDILSVFAEQHVLIAPGARWFWLLSDRMDGHIQYSFKILFKCNSNCSVLHYKVKHAEKCICTKQCLPLRVETKWDFDGMIIGLENITVSRYHGIRYQTIKTGFFFGWTNVWKHAFISISLIKNNQVNFIIYYILV